MANVKITELTALTDPASSDVLPIVDVGADTTKKVTIADLLENAGDGAAATPAFSFDNDKSVGMWRPGSEQLAFSTSGTTRLFIGSSGNCGIGTTNPAQKLHLSNAGDVAIQLQNNGTGGVNSAYFTKVDSDDSLQIKSSGGATTANITFYTGSTSERMRITNTGNVGIGTSSPVSPLDILTANARILVREDQSDICIDSVNTANSAFNDLKIRGNDIIFQYSGVERMRLKGPSGNFGIGTTNAGGKLDVYDGTNVDAYFGKNTDSVYIKQSGAVSGIQFGSNRSGQTGGNRILQYDRSSGLFQYLAGTNGSETAALTINNSNNVGIGTSSPTDKLTISSGSNQIGLDTGDQSTYGTLDLGHFANGAFIGTVAGSNAAANVLRLGTSGTERLRITSAGNVGIGTTSPTALLDIKGANAEFKGTNSTGIDVTAGTDQVFKFDVVGQKNNLYASAGSIIFRQDGNTWSSVNQYTKPTRIEFCTQDVSTSDTSTTPRMVIDQDGQVGIGTTSPGGKLHIESAATTAGWQIRTDSVGLSNESGFYRDASDNYELVLRNGAGGLSFVKNDGGASTANLSFTVQGSQRMLIDSSGRLLVGTSSALSSAGYTSNLQVQASSAGSAAISVINTSNDAFSGGLINYKSRGSSAVQAADSLAQFRFTGYDGTAYIEAARMSVEVDGTPGANDMPARLVFSTTADGASSPTERMRITSAGGALFNTTSVSIGTANYGTAIGTNSAGAGTVGLLRTSRNVDGTAPVFETYGNAGQFRTLGDGDAENTNNSYTGISDIKLKENIVAAGSQWDDLKALQVRKYNFKAETGYSTHTQIGLIAQEVELVSPGLVGETIDEETGESTKSVNYSVLYMKAVKALQEAMERIEQLETEMAAVKAQLS